MVTRYVFLFSLMYTPCPLLFVSCGNPALPLYCSAFLVPPSLSLSFKHAFGRSLSVPHAVVFGALAFPDSEAISNSPLCFHTTLFRLCIIFSDLHLNSLSFSVSLYLFLFRTPCASLLSVFLSVFTLSRTLPPAVLLSMGVDHPVFPSCISGLLLFSLSPQNPEHCLRFFRTQ